MRVTTFTRQDGTVEPAIDDAPAWAPFEEFDGKPLEGVDLAELDQTAQAELQLVRIAAGGHFAMHSSPDIAFCQIIEGAGTLRLPDGRELTYRGPELYVFRPGTLHEWDAVTSDTLLSVCLIRQAPDVTGD
jgi:quercetin dioxygenase-like cupin family protein